MKKTLSFLLVLAMVLSSFTFAFAAEDAEVPEIDAGDDSAVVEEEVETYVPYIKGKGDGTFAPLENITKEQVATIVARVKGLEEATPNFKDADKVGDWAKGSVGALQEAKIAEGNDKGYFEPKKPITRAELATILVKAFGDELEETVEVSFDDVADDAWYAEVVNKAAAAGIIKGNGEGKFNPKNNASRAETVIMINRVIGLEEAEGVEKLETELKDEAKWPEWAKAAILVASTGFEYKVEDGKVVILNEVKDIEAAKKAVEKAEETKEYEDIEAARELVEALEDEEVKKELIERLDAIEVEFEVIDVSAINPKAIKVTFNKEVEELAKKDIEVKNVKTLDRHYVKEVKLAEDKKSAEVSFYDALVTENTYKVVIGESEKEFDFVIGEVDKVEAETTQVVEHEEDTAIEYKVLDVNGLDITDIAKVKFESTLGINQDTGVVKLAEGKQGFVYVVVIDKEGKEIARSERITVKAEKAKAAKLVAYTTGKDNFTADKFEAKHSVRESDKDKKLSVFVEDQFGKNSVEKSELLTNVKFESLNKQVALVDRNNGKITPLKVGVADVRVKVGDINEIVQIKVEEDSRVASLELDKDEINLSDKLTDGQEVKVTVKDQYDEDMKVSGEITVEIKEGKGIIEEISDEELKNKSEATFRIKPVTGKEGKAIVEFSHKVKDDIFKTTLTVNVAKAGVTDGYVVEGFEKELDQNVSKDEKNTTSMILKVFGIDANEVKTGKVDDFKVELYKGEDKVKESNALVGNKIDATKLEKDTEYKVVVKVGTITIFEDTFKVVNTESAKAKPVVNQRKNSIKVDVKDVKTVEDLKGKLAGEIEATLDGKTKKVEIVKFLSDNAAVTGKDKLVAGKATLVITEVKVEDYKDVVDVNFEINLEVTDVRSELEEIAEGYVEIDKESKNITITKDKEDTKLSSFVTEKNLALVRKAGITEIKIGEDESIAIDKKATVKSIKEAIKDYKKLADLKGKEVKVTIGDETYTINFAADKKAEDKKVEEEKPEEVKPEDKKAEEVKKDAAK